MRELRATKLLEKNPVWPVLGLPQGVWADIWLVGEPVVHASINKRGTDYRPGVARVSHGICGGATRLSDGRVMAERPDIGARRAREIADLLQEAGLTDVAFEVLSQGEPEAADGIDDWRSRRTTVHVKP